MYASHPARQHVGVRRALVVDHQLQHGLQRTPTARLGLTRRTRLRDAEDRGDECDGLLGELVPAVDAPLEVPPAQVLHRLVFAPEAVDDVAAQQGALVEGDGEKRGPVDQRGEVDDADGVLGSEADDASVALRPCVEVVYEVLLEGPDRLVEDVLDVVFVREADDGGDLVEGEGGLSRVQPEVRLIVSAV